MEKEPVPSLDLNLTKVIMKNFLTFPI